MLGSGAERAEIEATTLRSASTHMGSAPDIPVPVTGIAVYGPVPPCAAWFMYTLCMGEPSTEPAGLKVPGKLVGPEGW